MRELRSLIEELRSLLDEDCGPLWDPRTGTYNGRRKKQGGKCGPRSYLPGTYATLGLKPNPSAPSGVTTSANVGAPPAPGASGGAT